MVLAARTPLLAGTDIRIRFRPAKHAPAIEVKARVLDQIPEKGTAVEFTEIAPEDRQLLLRIIHLKTAHRRQHPRVPLATQIYSEQQMLLAFSTDVSLGGMFAETKQPLPVGSRLVIRFHLDEVDPVIVATAEVRYTVEKLGMGIQFIELSPADRERISAYVSRSRSLADSTEEAAAA